jgi:hypothetical protein
MIKTYMKKLEEMPMRKKVIVFLLMLILLSSLIYLATIDKITTIEYVDEFTGNIICTEKYINNKIDGDYCPENPRFKNIGEDFQWNHILNKN